MTTKEGNWLREHLLEVYSVHEHGGSELQETVKTETL